MSDPTGPELLPTPRWVRAVYSGQVVASSKRALLLRGKGGRLSYFFPRRCFLFSFLGYVCEACSRPAGRAMAWFYFALSVVIGSVLLLIGLGVI